MSMNPPPIPDLNTPFLNSNAGGGLDNTLVQSGIYPLSILSGTWHSAPINLTGFNNMPLPYSKVPAKMILKNLGYYEEATYSVLNGLAPNRGGEIQQQVFVVFYEQRVYIGKNYGTLSENEGLVNTVVHAENGSLLHLINYKEDDPYYPPMNISDSQPTFPIIKQVSVPHGNSLLALGNYSILTTLPDVQDENCNPVGLNGTVVPQAVIDTYTHAYAETGGLSQNPNIVLKQYNDNLKAKYGNRPYTVKTTKFQVDTNANNGGSLTNIPFETKHTSVLSYSTTFWYVEINDGTIHGSFKYLQYTQRIELLMSTVPGVKFIHVDANTLSKVNT